jgi:hypothetical protein
MPKKHSISNIRLRGDFGRLGVTPASELTGHLDDVEPAMRRLGYAVARYYRKTDPQRATFLAIETMFFDFSKRIRTDIRRRARGT